MEKRDWNQFRFKAEREDEKGKAFFTQYLQPSLYLSVYLWLTDAALIMDCYNRCWEQFGDRYRFHEGGKTANITKIGDKQKAREQFSNFWTSPKETYLWRKLSNFGGKGIQNEFGGVGDCSFECWLHKNPETSDSASRMAKAIETQQQHLKEFNTDFLATGLRISSIHINIPADSFSTGAEFLQWVKAFSIISEGVFWSATAGYALNQYQGHVNQAANARAAQLLTDHPGFDFDTGIGNTMGRNFVPGNNFFVPQLKRINWLNIINSDAAALLGGKEKLTQSINESNELKVHTLQHGYIIQAGPTPQIGDNGKAPLAYHEAAGLLRPLLYRAHARDSYSDFEAVKKQWMYHFHRNG